MATLYKDLITDCLYYKIHQCTDSELKTIIYNRMVFGTNMHSYKSHSARKPNLKKHEKNFDSSNIFTYDCETSSTDKFAWSYEQTLTLKNSKGIITFVSRNIDDMLRLFNIISGWYTRYKFVYTYNVYSVLWVHNLSYDFQFLLNILKIDEILSRKKHDVIYAINEDKRLMFKDSYSLLGTSLAEACNNYNPEHKKLAGDMNHSLIRTPKTPLSKLERAYCIGDTVSLADIIDILLNSEGYGVKNGKYIGYKNFPNTKTGLVRNYMKDYCENNNLQKKKSYIMNKLSMDENEYKLLKSAYQGGYTHAFALSDSTGLKYTKGIILKNVASYDITSDYPYQMVSKKYPIGKFKKLMITDINEIIDELINNPESPDYAYLFVLTATNVRLKACEEDNAAPLAILPYRMNKDHCFENAEVDNGKVYKCDAMSQIMTEQDYISFMENYNYDTCNISEVYRAKKDYLPKWVIKAVFEFYKYKTTLKGVTGKEILYQYYKQLLNSVYGCCVQDPCKDKILYNSNDGWTTEETKSVNPRGRIVAYSWGVWVTAYARRTLISILNQLDPTTIVYCDTDSCKFISTPANKAVFVKANKLISYTNKQVAAELHLKYKDISYSDFTPSNNKGKIKELGLWDDEGTYLKFKTTGAKRYITYSAEHGLEVTCCGIAKKKLIQHFVKLVETRKNYNISIIKDKDGEEYYFFDNKSVDFIFNNFTDQLHISAGYDTNGESNTGKMNHSYATADINSPDYSNNISTDIITDYLGNTETIVCNYYIIMQPAEFTLNENTDSIIQNVI